MRAKTEVNYLKKELYELVKSDESIFEFIQEGSLDGLWYWDLENPENEWMNPKFWTVLGYDPDEMPHRSSAWQDIIDQDDLKIALKNFELHCENPNHPYDQIVRYTHKDSSTVWIRCRGIVIRDTNGKPIRMLGAHQNITSQKKSEEEALKKSNVLQDINKYALEISTLSYNKLIPQIGKKIKRLFGIKEVAITEYDEKNKELITKFATLSDEENSNISKFLGERIIGLKTPVTDDTYKRITSSIVSLVDSFHDLTFGKIPETVSKVIKRMYGLDWFVGIALMQDEKLHGTMILAGSKEQDIPDKEILMTFIKITTTEISRRKAEKLLKESESKYRALVENANDIIYHLSPNGVFNYVSPNWTEMLGYRIDETIGENIEQFVHPDDLQLCIDFLSKVLSTGQKQSGVEYRVKHKNGEILWHNSNGSPIKDENGNITSYIGVGRDITEQKIALEDIHKREVLFNSVLTTIPDLVSIHDKDLNIIFSNWNGFGAVELEKRKLYSKCYNTYRNYDSICPDCQARKVLETKKIHQSQVTLPDGRSYDIRVFPILDPAGDSETFVEWVRDISDIKRSERELRDKNEEYEALNEELLQANEEFIYAKEKAEESKANVTAIIEGTQSSIWAFNRNYEILYINNVFLRDFEQSFGVTLEKGTSLIDSLPEVLRPIWKPRYDRVLANEQFTIEDAVETEIGTLYIQVTFNPIIKNGKVIGGSCFGTNITEKKQIEIEIIKAKERAEESGRLKSAFLANMSHEIRTPMNGILGFANLLKEPNLSGDEQQEFISIIEKSGERMLNIINNIVDISKIEAGLMEVSITKTNINDQIDYVYNFFKPEVETKGLSFSLKKALPPEEATVKTDREKLYAILTNLVKNAIKYCEQGAIEFGYSLINEYNMPFLQFYVKDTGIGIPEDKLEAIFERFIQTHIADKMARQGAGLGLAISKAYVEMLAGKIWVESEDGNGSTFYFTLPYNTEAV
jgi:PAS domain S-box-containing protein